MGSHGGHPDRRSRRRFRRTRRHRARLRSLSRADQGAVHRARPRPRAAPGARARRAHRHRADAAEPRAGHRRAGVHRPIAAARRRRSARARHRHAGRLPGGDVGAREEARPRDRDAAPDLERGAQRHDRVLRPHARPVRRPRHLAASDGRIGRPIGRRIVRGAGARSQAHWSPGWRCRTGRRDKLRQAVTPPGAAPAPPAHPLQASLGDAILVRGFDASARRRARGRHARGHRITSRPASRCRRAGGCSSTSRGRSGIATWTTCRSMG